MLRKTAKELIMEFSEGKEKEIGIVGVRVSSLVGIDEKQRKIV